jgi:lactate dehydrogenase-like 2-hydroxyacid dehydrogenase
MSDSGKPLALFAVAPFGRLRETVEQYCEVIPLKGMTDRTAFFAGRGRKIRVIVTGGAYPLKHEMIENMPELGLIACFGSGYEGVDVAHARARGIEVTNAPRTNHDDVADVAIGLTISVIRKLSEGEQIIRSGNWKYPPVLPLQPSLGSLRYGIVGLGAIGAAIAERLAPFGGTIQWWGPRPKPEAKWPRVGNLLDLARDSDVLLLAHRADQTNRALIDAAVIDALGPTGYIINVSRGSAIDEPALIAALREKRLAGAGLDVFAQEPTDYTQWTDVPSVVLSPHIGGWASASIRAAEHLIGENIARYLAGQPPLTPV